MNFRKKSAAIAVTALASVALLSGCASDADKASENLSKAAESFEVNRRVILFNGITDKYLLVVEGRCSVESAESALGPRSLEVTCKIGPDQYKKHYGGLSDNVSYFVEQLDAVDVSVYHYRVIIKPESILPEFDVQTGKQ